MPSKFVFCQMEPRDIEYLATFDGNDKCIDCGIDDTDWASVSLGIFFCMRCSGQHRGLGTHVSFVRSVKMDSWTEEQVQKMKNGGNQRCKDFLRKHGVDLSSAIKDKYDTPAAQLYQQVIKARVAGEPEPTKLPRPSKRRSTTENASSSSLNRPMTGFGSSPPPPPPTNNMRQRMAAAGAYIQVLRNDATTLIASHKQRLQEKQQQRTTRRSSVLQSLASFGVTADDSRQ